MDAVKPLPDRDDIIEILRSVKDPETGISVFELGLVRAVDYEEENSRIIVRVDFKRRLPDCAGCVPIAWSLQRAITDELSKRFLSYKGVNVVQFTE
jgi:metal-sulfur cluster biosynthetic enzyme